MAGIVELQPLRQGLADQLTALLPLNAREAALKELGKVTGYFDNILSGFKITFATAQQRIPKNPFPVIRNSDRGRR